MVKIYFTKNPKHNPYKLTLRCLSAPLPLVGYKEDLKSHSFWGNRINCDQQTLKNIYCISKCPFLIKVTSCLACAKVNLYIFCGGNVKMKWTGLKVLEDRHTQMGGATMRGTRPPGLLLTRTTTEP